MGASLDDDKGDGAGSAYIFKRQGSFWSMPEKLYASDGVADDCFGNAVYISGNYALVAAPADDDYTGSAYIFDACKVNLKNGACVMNLMDLASKAEVWLYAAGQ